MTDPSRPPAPPPARSLDHIPKDILCARDYETAARHFTAGAAYDYIAGGSATGETADENLRAFQDWALMPRMLRDVRGGHTRLELAGTGFAHPIFMAPVAFQNLAHPSGETETARAAAAVESCMIASTLSSRTLEEIAQTTGAEKWFQLYFQPSRDATRDLVRRAAHAGYRAIVATLDASIQVQGHRALRAGFQLSPEPPANLRNYSPLPTPPDATGSRIFQGVMRHAPVWDDLEWLLKESALPVWVKGVQNPDDAQLLQDRGVTGLVVSNHGGRALDGGPSSLAVLPNVRKAVGENYPLLFDSGIRSGMDIFKALALGANAVLIGRLQVYALSVAGALGVAHMIKLLREELEICMAMTGCATLADISPAALYQGVAR